MGNAYVYNIKGLDDEFYIGVRWNYSGDPENDIWVNYFTSSSYIKQMIIQKGVEYFSPTVIKTFESEKEALEYEYNLIKENFENEKCLNRAMGKCTIWDDFLKKQVSNSMKKLWMSENYRQNRKNQIGEKNHNFGLKPWRNINSNKDSWKKSIEIFIDYQNEKWDFEKYGFGRQFLISRYHIAQGTARSLIKLLKNNWNPLIDSDFLLFLEENTRVS